VRGWATSRGAWGGTEPGGEGAKAEGVSSTGMTAAAVAVERVQRGERRQRIEKKLKCGRGTMQRMGREGVGAHKHRLVHSSVNR
jgi:hypothetical protein